MFSALGMDGQTNLGDAILEREGASYCAGRHSAGPLFTPKSIGNSKSKKSIQQFPILPMSYHFPPVVDERYLPFTMNHESINDKGMSR